MTTAVSSQGSVAIDSSTDMTKVGLVDAHAYSLIAAVEVSVNMIGTKEKLVMVRNPWGFREWNGDWSDSSQKWKQYPDASQNIEKALNKRHEDLVSKGHKLKKFEFKLDASDGCFWMSWKDYQRFFYITSVCSYERDWHTNWV